jgi:hypothetical protein
MRAARRIASSTVTWVTVDSVTVRALVYLVKKVARR